jgi:hypothetical protein
MLDLASEWPGIDQVSEVDNFSQQVFDSTPVPVCRPVGHVLDQLAQKCSMALIGRELWKLTGSLSVRTWGKKIQAIKKARQELTKSAWIYTGENWQKFRDSDVTEPQFPLREKQLPETRKKKGGEVEEKGGEVPLKPVDSSQGMGLRKRPLEMQMREAVAVAVNVEAAREKEAAAHAGGCLYNTHALITTPTNSHKNTAH